MILDVATNAAVSALLVGGLVYLGYVDLRRGKETIVGLSTWAFAVLPLLGLLIGLASLHMVWLPVRIGFIVLLVVADGVFMSKLFRKARDMR